MVCGKASRKKPETRRVMSMRGRPNSSWGMASRPVTRREASSRTRRMPSRARAWPVSQARRERDLRAALRALRVLIDAALGVDLHHEQARAALIDVMTVKPGELAPANPGVET
jgi:hypothetical protein